MYNLSLIHILQPAHMKSESLVIADQHAAVNTFPGLVHTARHTMITPIRHVTLILHSEMVLCKLSNCT